MMDRLKEWIMNRLGFYRAIVYRDDPGSGMMTIMEEGSAWRGTENWPRLWVSRKPSPFSYHPSRTRRMLAESNEMARKGQ